MAFNHGLKIGQILKNAYIQMREYGWDETFKDYEYFGYCLRLRKRNLSR